MRFREASEQSARSFYNSLPRQIKNLPVLDALMGSDTADLYEAIFELDLDPEADYALFDEHENPFYERPALRSIASAENVRLREHHGNGNGNGRGRDEGLLFPRAQSMSPRRSTASTPHGSPRRRPLPSLTTRPVSVESPHVPAGQPSPLSRLFGGARGPRAGSESAGPQVEASVRRVEALLEDAKELPVQRLREEMKELQVCFRLLWCCALLIGGFVGAASEDRELVVDVDQGHEARDGPIGYKT